MHVTPPIGVMCIVILASLNKKLLPYFLPIFPCARQSQFLSIGGLSPKSVDKVVDGQPSPFANIDSTGQRTNFIQELKDAESVQASRAQLPTDLRP